MSVEWYDQSIVSKIREITGDDRVTIVPPENLFRYIASLKSDEIKFPLISLTRLGYVLNRTSKSPNTSQGIPIKYSKGKAVELQSIPIRVNYQIDVITRKRDDNDALVDEIIFYFINHPSMSVNIKKGADISHKFSIFFNPDIEDNSDIESHISRGEYFRTTMTFYIPDGYLWKTTSLSQKKLNPAVFQATTDLNDNSKIYESDLIEIK